jgi:hypothetical protein
MARNWTADSTVVDLGNIASAQFKQNDDWSVLAFLYLTGDFTRPVLTKYGAGDTDQFLMRWSGTPQKLQVIVNGTFVPLGSGITQNKWYLGAVIQKGSTNNVRAYTVDTSGAFLDDNLNANRGVDSSDLTEPIRIGKQDTATAWRGRLAFVSYFSREFSRDDVLGYLNNPWKVLSSYASTCEFFHPLGRVDGGGQEVDFSGNGNVGTVTGTTVVDNPPVGGSSPSYFYAPTIVPTLVQKRFLAASAAKIPATNGALKERQDGTSFYLSILAFDTSKEEAYWAMRLAGYTGGNLKLNVFWYARNATSGGATMRASVSALTPEEDSDSVETDAMVGQGKDVFTHLGTEAKRLHKSTIVIDVRDNATLNDWFEVKLRRDAADADDTLANEIRVPYCTLTYT